MIQLFDGVAFIEEGPERPLDTSRPYLYNDHGLARFHPAPLGRLIPQAEKNHELLLGHCYENIGHKRKSIQGRSGAYKITEFDFRSKTGEVVYQPLWATAHNAQAFGMTLLESGECIHFQHPHLVLGQFTYGKWAGHQSPYLGPARQRELLSYNPTDLEYHDFAHVFFARHGRLPLVISVARWLPAARQIYLADLWLKPGDALVLPPQCPSPDPGAGRLDSSAASQVVDLHGNRNAALACWFSDGEHSLQTETILADQPTMNSREHGPHYHQEQTPTRHTPAPNWPNVDFAPPLSN